MAKAVNDLAAAKAAKQKKIAIVGSVLLVALLAFQVPRTLKMLNRQNSAPVRAAATTTPTETTGSSTSTPSSSESGGTSTPGTGTSSAAQVGADALVVNADLSPAPLDGQLADLTAFTTKDPFVQKDVAPPKGSSSSSGDSSGDKGGSTGKGSGAKDGGFTTPGDGGTTPTPAAPAPTIAQISVNGVEESVTKGTDFPAASPLFHLVALTAKTAKISIAGGSLASGSATVTLKLGKPLTLMNTADGSRYVIVLVSVGASTTTAPPATTVPATTTPTTTTPTTP